MGHVKPVTIILGAQWGDEGKGKIVDLLATKADIVCRFNGGNNAGHTIVANGIEYDFHLLPSGIIHENCISVIGNGVVVNLPELLKEIEKNEAKGLKNWQKRLYISDRAHLVFDLHQEVDGIIESRRGQQSLGTTKKGIGPTYSSKAIRNGIRICDLTNNFNEFAEKYRDLVRYTRETFNILHDLNVDAELEKYKKLCEIFRPCVKDVTYYVNQQVRDGSKFIIAEGANAAMLDLDFGTYPFVTSSSTTIGGVCSGLGIPPTYIGNIVAIVKAYTTRVGLGAFATELTNDIGEFLQTTGKEFGVTTGRKRRCGWLDLVVVKYSHMINDYSCIALTKLDILDQLKEIKVAIAYKYEDKILDSFPASMDTLEKVEVVYETFEGWQQPICDCNDYDSLPTNAKKYIEFIENYLHVPVKYIGVGKSREATIIRD